MTNSVLLGYNCSTSDLKKNKMYSKKYDDILNEFTKWLSDDHLEVVGKRLLGESPKTTFIPNVTYVGSEDDARHLKTTINEIKSGTHTTPVVMFINISKEVKSNDGAHWIFAYIFKGEEGYVGCLVDPKKADISSYNITCGTILTTLREDFDANDGDFFQLNGPQTGADNDSCGIWVLQYLESVIGSLGDDASHDRVIGGLSELVKGQRSNELDGLRERYAQIYHEQTSNEDEIELILTSDEIDEIGETTPLMMTTDLEFGINLPNQALVLQNIDKLEYFGDVLAKLLTSHEAALTSGLKAGKRAATIKASINVIVPAYVSVALIIYASLAIVAAFSEQDCEDTGFNWLAFVRVTASFVFSLPVVASGLAYILCKQYEQVCEARVQLSLAKDLVRDEEAIMALGSQFMKLTDFPGSLAVGSIRKLLEREYEDSVKFRKRRYAAITLSTSSQPTASVASILLSATGYEKAGAIIDLIGAFLFTLGAIHTTYYKVWDASKIRAINNQLSDVKELLFKNNTDCIVALAHAIHGEEDVKKILPVVGSNQWKKIGIPVELQHVLAEHRQKMSDFCQHLAKVVNRGNICGDTLNIINEVKIITAQLLDNHAIMAGNIDLGNPMKVANQNTVSTNLSSITEPFKKMAHQLRVSKRDERLSRMSQKDSYELQNAAHQIGLRFDSLQGHFQQHAKAITNLQTTTETLIDETKKLKSQMNGMEFDHKNALASMDAQHKSTLASMDAQHNQETQSLRSTMASMDAQHKSTLASMQSSLDDLKQQLALFMRQKNQSDKNSDEDKSPRPKGSGMFSQF